MTESAKALQAFFSRFLPAYTDGLVPPDAELPYITYSPVFNDWRNTGTMSAIIWYPGQSVLPAMQKADEIGRAVNTGKTISIPGGYVHLKKGAPWAQPYNVGPDTAGVYLNFGIETFE